MTPSHSLQAQPQVHSCGVRRPSRHFVAIALLWLLALWVGMTMNPARAAQPLGGTVLRMTATASYIPAGLTQVETVSSNLLTLNVASVEALTLSQDQALAMPPGAQVTLSHQLTNVGNITSSYKLAWGNGGGTCPSSATQSLSGMKLVRDTNANGVADGSEPVLALNTAGALTLAPGESVTLLALGTVPTVASGSLCATLTATTASQGVTASNRDSIDIANVAVLSLNKSAVYTSPLQAGLSRIDYTVRGVNIGAQTALPTTSTAATGGTAITVDGAATSVLLLRDVIPTGTQYVAGSLQSSLPGALRLFRLPGDAAFAYRSAADDSSAVEVAVALPAGQSIGVNVSFQMQFGATITSGATVANINNTAEAYFNNGVQASSSSSNTVAIPLPSTRIGVAEAASQPLANGDGTSDVILTVRVKNYGNAPLYDVQLNNVLQGASGSTLGTYTSAASPGTGQYTVRTGTLKVNQPNGSVAGQVASVSSTFDGATNPGLLASGAVLPVGGDLTVQFTVRFNTSGRSGTLYTSTTATAATLQGATATVSDDSVNGSDPDPDADGNPGNNSSPTPIAATQPLLSLVKTVSLPRVVSTGVYDVDFSFKVTNNGTASAPNVRIVDNLNCAFSMDKADGAIAGWELRGGVHTGSGVLTPSSSFTGNATCDRTKWDAADPTKFQTEFALSLVDGSRALAAGQSEQVGVTVRVTLKSSAIGNRVSFTNKGWAVSLTDNVINVTGAMVAGGSTTSVQGILIDPQGTVYDAVSRNPITGAVVTVRRQSCDGGTSGAITADQVLAGNSGVYTYNSDGTMSMTTGSDGSWQFYWLAPPVTGKCTYTLSVKPPSSGGYIYPSQRIPAQGGTFATCGAIVPSGTSPKDGEATNWYTSFSSGFNSDGTACDVMHDHIPLDPGVATGLLLRKSASKQQVEFGDFLDYALTVSNKTGATVNGLSFSDTLPAGFKYVAGSTKFNGSAVANPSGGVGPTLVWSFPDLALTADQVVILRYRVSVGVGARISGDATNRAQASSKGYTSNEASQTVRVNGGVFSDEAFAFGKVYMDCKRDRQQEGEDEPGVPGVRLWLEDGTNVMTDGEGRWSLYGLKPVTHVLRLDETTLPVGARVAIQDNRNAGTPSSRFLDLKKGEFQKGNFPLEGCDDAATKADVEARRKAAAKSLDAELAAALRTRLDPKGTVVTTSDTRGMPASGQINGSGGNGAGSLTTNSGPLIAMPAGATNSGSGAAGGSSFLDGAGSVGSTSTLSAAQQAAKGMGPGAAGQVPMAGTAKQPASADGGPTSGLVPQPVAPSTVDLEKLLPDLPRGTGFIDLRDKDTMPGQVVNVRVKGPMGAQLQLAVNGDVLDGRRVGKKATLASTNTTAWEYIGVQLKPGSNQLRLQVLDDVGIPREQPVEISVIAPDKLGLVRIVLPKDARADLRTPVPVEVLLTDAAGVPVTARSQITLESDAGRWQEDDLNPTEPGLQAFIEGGKAVFHLIPPGTPGDLRVRATVNAIVQEARLTLLPDLRPMIAVGVVEGTLDLTKRGKLGVDQLPAGAAFEQELSSLGSNGDTGNARAGGRAAFFLKGAIKGDYLLTAALDTGKSSKDRLFRDIRPEEFYPVYGDSSERGYDAQSSQKLYVRIDKNRSYLLYGDFQTSSSTEVRKLSQTSRTLTGMKGVYDDNGMRITAYGSRTSQTQQIEEFAGKGISGPYYLAGNLGDMVENSETVEIVSRDRNQASVIVKTTSLTRYVDYTLEPTTRRLMFVSPVSAVDSSLNPQSIRVTYEVDAGGPKYTVAGVDAQFKVGERVQAGVVAHIDDNPENRRRMTAATTLARLGENTSMAAEAVRTHSDDKGAGSASRVEVRHQTEDLGVSVQAARASTGFDNPAAGFTAGNTEASVRTEYRISPTLAARAEAIYSKSATDTEAARGEALSLLKRFNNYFAGEVGLRHGATSSSSASMFSYDQVSSFGNTSGASSVTSLGSLASTASSSALATSQNDMTTVRARLTATVPGLPQAQVFVEGEQATNDSSKHMAAVGGNYAITDKTRVYGRYELSSTLYEDTSTSTSRNVGILGIESAYMEGGRVYNEYRLADADSSRTAQIANGVRNTIKLGEHWSVTGGIERARALGTVSSDSLSAGLGSSTAVTSGVEYTNGRFRASGILEGRNASDANTALSSMGFGYRLDDEWSLLARSIYNSSKGVGTSEGNERTQARQQIGVAYRPVNDDRWNALARYEHKSERIRGSDTTTATMSGNAFGSDNSLPGDYDTHILSAHVNFNPSAGNTISGRLAAKRSTYDDGTLKSSYSAQLLYGRWTRDLTDKWDMSVQGGLLHGSGGALQKSLGMELGYQLMRDLWVSVGYNAIGLSDRDLTAGEYTSKGAYFRLRFKFDETGLGFERTGSKASTSGGSSSAGSTSAAAAAAQPGSPPSHPIEAPPRLVAEPPQAPAAASSPSSSSTSSSTNNGSPAEAPAATGGQ